MLLRICLAAIPTTLLAATALTAAAADVIDDNGGDKGRDVLYLGKGRDNGIAGPGADVVYGGGDDTVYGTNAAIHEGAGHEDRDVLQGGRGDDRIYLGGGSDRVLAGPGNDEFVGVTADHDRDVVNCGDGRHDRVSLYHKRDRHDRFRHCERVRVYHGEV
jgi:Ca2+-binding RTX toxin-like protein